MRRIGDPDALAAADEARAAKVGEFDGEVAGEQELAGAEVVVEDIVGVDVGDCAHGLGCEGGEEEEEEGFPVAVVGLRADVADVILHGARGAVFELYDAGGGEAVEAEDVRGGRQTAVDAGLDVGVVGCVAAGGVEDFYGPCRGDFVDVGEAPCAHERGGYGIGNWP